MFKFKFGLMWTLFVTPIFIMCLVVPGEERGGVDMSPLLFIIFLIFEAVGIFLLTSGIKEIIRDKKTKKYGKMCYGIVRDIQNTGSYVNGNPEYQAVVEVKNPETSQIEKITEIIGFDRDKYPINSYVQCKYYEGDINIEKLASEYEVPIDITREILPIEQTSQVQQPNYMNLEFSPDREYVTIDGVQYKKVS